MDSKRTETASDIEKIDLLRIIEEFLRALGKLLWLPVLLALVLAAFMGFSSWRSYTPMYRSEASFAVSAANASIYGSSSAYYNRATASQLASTFPYIISSELFQKTLRTGLGVQHLNGSISSEVLSSTSLFSVKVTSNNPQDAYEILNGVISYYPAIAKYVVGNTQMTIISGPSLPTEPVNSNNPGRAAFKGAALGVLIGLALIFLYSATRRTVRTRDDVRKLLNLSCLASLPAVKLKRRSNLTGGALAITNPKLDNSFVESVRGLRVKFLQRARKNGCQVVTVTSTLAAEGKTTASANLALALGQSDLRVILIDLDLRKPSVKAALGISGESMGIVEILESGKFYKNDLIEIEGTQLRVIAGDKAAADAKPLLESRQLAALIQILRRDAELIILDTPPSGLLADSAAISKLSDGVLYVVKAGYAQLSRVLDGLHSASIGGLAILGCVLNCANDPSSGYGNSYGYGRRSGGKYKNYKD